MTQISSHIISAAREAGEAVASAHGKLRDVVRALAASGHVAYDDVGHKMARDVYVDAVVHARGATEKADVTRAKALARTQYAQAYESLRDELGLAERARAGVGRNAKSDDSDSADSDSADSAKSPRKMTVSDIPAQLIREISETAVAAYVESLGLTMSDVLNLLTARAEIRGIKHPTQTAIRNADFALNAAGNVMLKVLRKQGESLTDEQKAALKEAAQAAREADKARATQAKADRDREISAAIEKAIADAQKPRKGKGKISGDAGGNGGDVAESSREESEAEGAAWKSRAVQNALKRNGVKVEPQAAAA